MSFVDYTFNENMICTDTLPQTFDIPAGVDDSPDEAFQACEDNKDCGGVMAHNCKAGINEVGAIQTFHLCSRCASFTEKSAADPTTCLAIRSVIPGK